MTFVPIDRLKEGMMLDRDVYLYDYKTCKIAMLRSGQVLTNSYIQKLDELQILGAYIHSDDRDGPGGLTDGPIRPELKEEAISNIQCVFKMFDKYQLYQSDGGDLQKAGDCPSEQQKHRAQHRQPENVRRLYL